MEKPKQLPKRRIQKIESNIPRNLEFANIDKLPYDIRKEMHPFRKNLRNFIKEVMKDAQNELRLCNTKNAVNIIETINKLLLLLQQLGENNERIDYSIASKYDPK